jgi:FkbM family methyltransferase
MAAGKLDKDIVLEVTRSDGLMRLNGATIGAALESGYTTAQIFDGLKDGWLTFKDHFKIQYNDDFDCYLRTGTDHLDRIKDCMKVTGPADIREGELVMDIGAHVGGFSLMASRLRGARVVAFECAPDTYEILKLNSDGEKILPFQQAVIGGTDVTIDLYLSKNHLGEGSCMPSTVPTARRDKIQVTAVNFTDTLWAYKPDVLKIDVEGAEFYYDYKVLPQNLRSICIEFHFFKDKKVASVEAAERILDYLNLQGFQIYHSANPTILGGNLWVEKNWWTSIFFLRRVVS